jgi:hypothetical protein
MRGRTTDLRTFGLIATALLFLGAASGLLAYVWISRQSAYLNQRNFRLLAAQSARLRQMVENSANKLLPNTANQALALVPENERSGCALASKTFTENLKQALDLTSLKLEGAAKLTSAADPKPPFRPTTVQDGDEFRLLFDFGGHVHSGEGDTGCDARFRAVTGMNDLLGSIDRRVFDDLVIVEQVKAGKEKESDKTQDDDNVVIYQRSMSGPRLTKVGPLKDEKGQDVPLSRIFSSTNVSLLDLGGTRYRAFVQPVRMSLSGGEPAEGGRPDAVTWSLLGLVRSDRFRAESLSLSYNLLLLVLFLFVLISASWPLLNLWSLQPTDRVGRRDGLFVSASVLMLSALGIFFVLDVWSCVQLNRRLDEQLEGLAGQIQENFHAELSRLTGLLDAFDQDTNLEASPTTECLDGESPPVWLKKGAYFETLTLVQGGDEPGDDSIGRQKRKWTIERSSTPLIPVGERAYFKAIHEGRGWRMDSQKPLFLEPVVSYNTGRITTVLARPGPGWKGAGAVPGSVEALVAKLISLRNVVVPPGFGYAVIEESGRVLFHSDSNRMLNENFFAECDNNPALKALVAAHASGTIDASYTGRDHRLHVVPMKGPPWTLVAFRNEQAERTANLELLSSSILLYLAYACIFLLPALALCFSSTRWMWHEARRAPAERLLLAFNIALIALTVIGELAVTVHHHVPLLAFFLPPFALLLNCVRLKAETEKRDRWPYVLALAALPVGLLVLGKLEHPDGDLPVRQALLLCICIPLFLRPWEDRLSRRTDELLRWLFPMKATACYILLVVSLVTLLGVVPAIAFFRAAHDTEMEILVKHRQIGIARAVAERDERVTLEYREIPQPATFLQERLGDTLDLPHEKSDVLTDRAPETACRGAHDSVEHRFDVLMAAIRPMYDEYAVQTHELLSDCSADDSRHWVLQGNTVTLTKGPSFGNRFQALRSRTPVLAWPEGGWGWFGVTVAALLLPIFLFLLVRSVMRRLFWYDLPDPVLNPVDVAGFEAGENTLVLGLPGSGKSALIRRPEFEILDLCAVETDGAWTETMVRAGSCSKQGVAIDHFEILQDDPACNIRKLRLLETLLARNLRVLVASASDPIDFPLGGADPSGPACRMESDGDRWARAWSAFPRRVVLYDDARGISMKQVEEVLARTALPAESAAALRRECRPTSALRRIGLELLSVPAGLFDAEQVVLAVLGRARPYYRSLWATCSREERQALFDLAEDGFVNAKGSVIRRLLEKGLAVRDPRLAPMNESFGRCVMALGHAEGTAMAGKWRPWTTVRTASLAVGLVVAFVVFIVQPQFLNLSTTFLAAVAAGIPTAMKVFDLIRGKQVKV